MDTFARNRYRLDTRDAKATAIDITASIHNRCNSPRKSSYCSRRTYRLSWQVFLTIFDALVLLIVATGERRRWTSTVCNVCRRAAILDGGTALLAAIGPPWIQTGDPVPIASTATVNSPIDGIISSRRDVRSTSLLERDLLHRTSYAVPLGGALVPRDRRDADRSLLGSTNSTHPQRNGMTAMQKVAFQQRR